MRLKISLGTWLNYYVPVKCVVRASALQLKAEKRCGWFLILFKHTLIVSIWYIECQDVLVVIRSTSLWPSFQTGKSTVSICNTRSITQDATIVGIWTWLYPVYLNDYATRTTLLKQKKTETLDTWIIVTIMVHYTAKITDKWVAAF